MKAWPLIFSAISSILLSLPAQSQAPITEIKPGGIAKPANTLSDYHALRYLTPTGDAFTVQNVSLKRDAGEFTLQQGTIYLYTPVRGHVTGAVFVGTASFHLAPPGASERHSLSLLTKSPEMKQNFTTAVFRFTDDTAEELRKGSTGTATHVGAADSAANALQSFFHKKINSNFDGRILEDVMSDKPGGLFLASFKMPGAFGGNVLYIVDPQGAPGAEPDEIELSTFDDDQFDVWAAFHPAQAVQGHGVPVHVSSQWLDTTIEKNGHMTASALTTLTAQHGDVKVVALNLYRKLHVTGVYGPNGDPLDFVQEGEDDDPQFFVILNQPLLEGKSITLRTDYGGKDVVLSEGSGNYYLSGAARESWYPNGFEYLGGYASYHMTFHVPKDLQVVATAKQVSANSDGRTSTSVWQTEAPIAVAGFNLGSFLEADAKGPNDLKVEAFANKDLPDFAKPLANTGVMGSMETTSALKRTLSEGSVALKIYTDFFGALPYDHVALTQQPACNYGQSWPMLVYLPVCYFWDSTVRHQLGLMDSDRGYWTTVTPHEVAHQWWGQTVGFASYRDQWMSEGFANFSASLFLLLTEPKPDRYHEFWSDQRKRIIDKNANGLRPIDVGPVTMGTRLSNAKAGDVYSMLAYSKGAYILHMLEMLYWSPDQKEEPLKAALHDFVSTYKNRAATTEDFKATLERNLPPWLDIDGNHRLDWFFDAYVYGTTLPRYVITSEFGKDGDATTVHVKLTQSNVPDDFRMLVPVYLDLGDNKVVRVFNVPLKGNTTLDKTLKLGKLPAQPKRLLLNYNYDILSD